MDILDAEFFSHYSLVSATTIPIIVAICQALKMAEWRFVQAKYMPFISIIVGILISMLLFDNGFYEHLGSNILQGILLGLASSGLYSGVKVTQVAIMRSKENKIKAKSHDHHKK